MVLKSGQDPFAEDTQGENVLSLRDIFSIARKRLWVIALVMIATTGMAVGYSLQKTPQYEAAASILIGQESGIVEGPGNVAGLVDLTSTMSYAVRTVPVAEETISRLNLDWSPGQLLAGLSSDPVSQTQFVIVRYRDSDPETARLVTNTVAEVFSDRIYDASSSTTGSVSATVWDRASVPTEPVSPNHRRDALLGLLLGATLGVGLAFLLEYRDGSCRSPKEAEQITGVPTFGVIPRLDEAS